MNAVARKMPVVTRKIEIGEGPYAGWWAEMRTNPPMRVIDALVQSMDAVEFSRLVVAWNFVDEEGAPLAAEQILDIPPDLFKVLWQLYLREVWHPFWFAGTG